MTFDGDAEISAGGGRVEQEATYRGQSPPTCGRGLALFPPDPGLELRSERGLDGLERRGPGDLDLAGREGGGGLRLESGSTRSSGLAHVPERAGPQPGLLVWPINRARRTLQTDRPRRGPARVRDRPGVALGRMELEGRTSWGWPYAHSDGARAAWRTGTTVTSATASAWPPEAVLTRTLISATIRRGGGIPPADARLPWGAAQGAAG